MRRCVVRAVRFKAMLRHPSQRYLVSIPLRNMTSGTTTTQQMDSEGMVESQSRNPSQSMMEGEETDAKYAEELDSPLYGLLIENMSAALKLEDWELAISLFKQSRAAGLEIGEEGHALLLRAMNMGGYMEEALKMYDAMVEKFEEMSAESLGEGLWSCAVTQRYDRFVDIHNQFRSSKQQFTPRIYSSIILVSVRKEKYDVALELYEDLKTIMSPEDDIQHLVNATALVIYALGQRGGEGDVERAEDFYQQMEMRVIRKSKDVLMSLAHLHITENGDMLKGLRYMSIGRKVREVVALIPDPYSKVLDLMEREIKQEKYCNTLSIFDELVEHKIPIERPYYHAVLKACKLSNNLERGILILRHMEKAGLTPTEEEFAIVIDICMVMKMSLIQPLIENMEKQGFKKTIRAYNTLLQACTLDYDWEAASGLMKEMARENVPLDSKLAQKLVFVFGSCSKPDLAMAVINQAIQANLDTPELYREAISMCRKNKLGVAARGYLLASEKHGVDFSLYPEAMHASLEASEWKLIQDIEIHRQHQEKLQDSSEKTHAQPETNPDMDTRAFRVVALYKMGKYADAVELYNELGFQTLVQFCVRKPFNSNKAVVAAMAIDAAFESAKSIGDVDSVNLVERNARSILEHVEKSDMGNNWTYWRKQKWAKILANIEKS